MMRGLLAVSMVVGVAVAADARWGKIEHTKSLRPPFADLNNNWITTGSTEFNDKIIRFLPQEKKTSAHLWQKEPVRMASWEVILEFSVQGIAPLSTGEGLAFWHVANPGMEGAVYGHSDKFNGLGIFFDSYDSDGNGEAESYVLAMQNDGTKTIDEEGAGKQLGVCFADYRNLPHPARAKIAYTPEDGGTLSVGLDIDNSGKFKACISVKDVQLQSESQHYALSVSDYATNFDIMSFIGINTSQKYDAPSADETKSYVDVNAEDTTGEFEHHASFQRVVSKLHSLSSRLVNMEEQLQRQFSSVFQSHHKSLEKHTTGVQTAIASLHTDIDNQLMQLSRHAEVMSNALGSVSLSAGSDNGQEQVVKQLTEVRVQCAKDNHRGQGTTQQLSDAVNTLTTRQEEIKTDMHSSLVSISTQLEGGCGASPMWAVILSLVGVGIGSVVTTMATKSTRRQHLL